MRKLKKYDNIGYIFVLPAFVLYLAFALIPAISTFRLSFFEWDFLSPNMKPVGFDNFITLFQDSAFRTVVGNTVYFTVISVIAKVGFGVLLADLVAKRIKNRFGSAVMESVLFMPIVIPMSVVALVFNKMYDYEFGVFNSLLRLIGVGPVGWLTDINVALNSVIAVDIFKGVGFFFIIALVGIRGIPQTYYEAAEIDGSSLSRQFFAITLPLIGNTLVFLFITAFISSFQVFDPIYIMLNGLFGDTKITINYMMWQQAFFYRDVGYAAAISILSFGVVLAMTLLQFVLSKVLVKNDDY